MRTKTMDIGTLKQFGAFLRGAASTTNPSGPGLNSQVQASLGLSEGTDSDGGFVVPSDWSTILMDSIQNQTEIASRCARVPVKGNKIRFPGVDETSRANNSRFGGIQTVWGTEGATISASNGKFWSAELNLNKLVSALYTTEELMDDSALLGAFVEKALTQDMAFRLDEAILLGSGEGQPLGIMKSNALITQAKDSGQAAGTISATNLIGMFGRMLPASRKNAVWLVSTEVEEQLYALSAASGTSATGALLFTPGDYQAPYGRLLNRPVLPMEQCPAIGVTGDIVFADLPSYLIAQKPLDLALSIHVQWTTGQPVFRCVMRVDGQSSLRTPITSYNGGPTKSAFVALAAR